MKRGKLGFLSAFLLLLFLSSCETGGDVYCRSFVNGYIYAPNKIEVASYYGGEGIAFDIYGSKRVDMFSTGEDLTLYDIICKENNDMTYNNNIRQIIDGAPRNVSYYPNFASINIVSDMDFDAEHPAGTSLNDVMWIAFRSYYDYIASNYTSKVPYSANEGEREYFKKLEELSSDELRLLCHNTLGCAFRKYPDELKEHTITFTITDVNGNSISCSFVYDFAKYKFVDYSELEEYYKID